MASGSKLLKYKEKFPKNFIDVGIAEEHALILANSLAVNNKKPFVSIYSTFLQRGYDQLSHDLARMNLKSTVLIDRAGLVGEDGETHQGLLDLSFTNTIPNFVVMAPKDFCELEQMLEFALDIKKPVLIRYPRGAEEMGFEKTLDIALGKAEILSDGEDVTIIAIGKMVSKAIKVSEMLKTVSLFSSMKIIQKYQ